MACKNLYDFMTGAKIQPPTDLRTGAAGEEHGRYGVRAILNPGAEARKLIRDQMRILAELKYAAPDD
jgi:hypothetical protein